MIPKSDAKILIIDCYDDLLQTAIKYPLMEDKSLYVDFEKLSLDYDGFHLTKRGQIETQLPPLHPNQYKGIIPYQIRLPYLYGWDCESTLWFKWCFTDCIKIGQVRKNKLRLDSDFKFESLRGEQQEVS
jgi:hypothetical protein